MESTVELLRRAIQAARNGRELTARELFQEVVRREPGNEVAWMWLSGLLDDLEDRIAACEKVLFINPRNASVRTYLNKLLFEQYTLQHRKQAELDERLALARASIEKKDRASALVIVQDILRQDKQHVGAWLLFADLATGIEDKIRAYESVLQADPSNIAAREAITRFRHFQQDPLDMVAYFEEQGRIDEAIALYQEIAAKSTGSPEFDRVYREIVRLEDLKIEKIRYIRPAVSIARLTAGLPVLYFLLVLLQEGLNPVAHFTFYLWGSAPLVVLGSFLISMATVRSRHALWQRLFNDRGAGGSRVARWTVALAGWILVVLPHLLLVRDSLVRLDKFQIPPIPYIG